MLTRAHLLLATALVGLFAFSAKPAQALPVNFFEEEYAAGLFYPTAMAWLPDGRLLVTEKRGLLRVIENGKLNPTSLLILSVNDDSERGLLGVAIDPAYATNHYLYLYYTRKASPVKNRLSRFRLNQAGTAVDSGSEKILIDHIASDAGNHNGGAIHFGRDGKLYVAVGDGGKNSSNGQSLSTLSGKILRINRDGSIPTDNPFRSRPGAKGQIWAYGFRNPFTFAIDPIDGRLYVNDVGLAAWEEVNRVTKGGNYGWPICEGTCSRVGFKNPIYAYRHGPGSAAITGAAFYRGNKFPSRYAGSYFFGDYTKGFIRERTSGGTVKAFMDKAKSPIDILTGSDGALYYLSIGKGKVYRVAYATTNKPPTAKFSATPSKGVNPLAVTFDAAASSDPEYGALSYAWSYGDGSTGTGRAPKHTFQKQGRFTVVLTVRDQYRLSAKASKIIEVGNFPSATIAPPAFTSYFEPGDKVTFGGTATDKEDGTLPASAFSWTIVLRHNDHEHPFRGPIRGVKTGYFTVPNTAVLEEGMFYRIKLTVTDKTGLRTTVTRDILPSTPVTDSPYH